MLLSGICCHVPKRVRRGQRRTGLAATLSGSQIVNCAESERLICIEALIVNMILLL